MSRRRVHATGPGGRARALAAGLPALAAVLALAACGSSGKGLIPSANAGPLVGDFETVQQAAESGGGNCTATEAALVKTEEDFRALPPSVDRGLRANLRQGIANLRNRARELCTQPPGAGTHTTATTKTTTTTTPKTTTTTTTPTTTTPAPPVTTPTEPSSGGGTPAPGESQGATGAGGSEEKPPAAEEPSSGGAAGGAGAPEGTK